MLRLFSLLVTFFALTPLYGQKNNHLSRQADAVVATLLSRALTHDIDANACDYLINPSRQRGHKRLKQKVLSLMERSQPLIFTLVGFPFKSSNTKKNVLNSLPDQGERAALMALQSLMDALSEHYPAGAKVQIYTDGLAFCDVIGVSYKTVIAYEHALKRLATDLPSVTIITLQDLLPGLSPKEIQTQIKDEPYSSSLDDVQRQILKRRLLKEFDSPQGQKHLLKTSLYDLADEMHQRSQQINSLYKKKFPPSVALSVHYQSDLGKKIGLSLCGGTLTPWHGVAVLRKDGSFEIRRKSDVEDTHTLTTHHINGINCYFYSYK